MLASREVSWGGGQTTTQAIAILVLSAGEEKCGPCPPPRREVQSLLQAPYSLAIIFKNHVKDPNGW